MFALFGRPVVRWLGGKSLAVRLCGMQVGRALGGQLSELLLQHRDEITHSRPELAVDIGFKMTYATLQQLMLYGDVRPTEQPASLELLARELARAFVAYLTESPEGFA